MQWVGMPIFTTDFKDKMGLIYQISGSPNWRMPSYSQLIHYPWNPCNPWFLFSHSGLQNESRSKISGVKMTGWKPVCRDRLEARPPFMPIVWEIVLQLANAIIFVTHSLSVQSVKSVVSIFPFRITE
jgi:hypothetical protein